MTGRSSPVPAEQLRRPAPGAGALLHLLGADEVALHGASEPVAVDVPFTRDWTAHTACVDFSAVRGGSMVAYRWNGEPEIHWENYIPHDPAVVAPTPSG